MLSRDLPLLEVAFVSAVVDRVGALGEIQFDDPSRAARHELSIVTDKHDASAHTGDDVFEAGESVEVEVVGRFVEQHDVES